MAKECNFLSNHSRKHNKDSVPSLEFDFNEAQFLEQISDIMTRNRRAAVMAEGAKVLVELDLYIDGEPAPESEGWKSFKHMSRFDKRYFAVGLHALYDDTDAFDIDNCRFRVQDVLDQTAEELPVPTREFFCQQTGGKWGYAPLGGLRCTYAKTNDECGAWPKRTESDPGNVIGEEETKLLAMLWVVANEEPNEEPNEELLRVRSLFAREDNDAANEAAKLFGALKNEQKMKFAMDVRERMSNGSFYDCTVDPNDMMKPFMPSYKRYSCPYPSRKWFADTRPELHCGYNEKSAFLPVNFLTRGSR